MRDFNVVIKNKRKFEELGWVLSWLGTDQDKEWLLMTFTPNGREDYLRLSNDYFLNELQDIVENFDLNDYIEDALQDTVSKPNYKVLVEDGEWFYNQLGILLATFEGYEGFDEIEKWESDDDEDEDEDVDDEDDHRDQDDVEDGDTRKKSKKENN